MAEKGLLAAMLAVQRSVGVLPKDKTNPHFRSKYTSLDTIVEIVGPLLVKNELVWAALPSGTHDEPTLTYQLAHAPTGEELTGEMPLLLDKSSSQAFGSAITYSRRYALCAVLNLVADEDDDGNSAGERQAPKRQVKESDGPASDAQRKFLNTLLKRAQIKNVDDANRTLSLMAGREIKAGTAELTKGEATDIIERLKNGDVPSVQFPSDVPGDADGFEHPRVEGEAPWDPVAAVQEGFNAVEEPAPSDEKHRRTDA